MNVRYTLSHDPNTTLKSLFLHENAKIFPHIQDVTMAINT